MHKHKNLLVAVSLCLFACSSGSDSAEFRLGTDYENPWAPCVYDGTSEVGCSGMYAYEGETCTVATMPSYPCENDSHCPAAPNGSAVATCRDGSCYLYCNDGATCPGDMDCYTQPPQEIPSPEEGWNQCDVWDGDSYWSCDEAAAQAEWLAIPKCYYVAVGTMDHTDGAEWCSADPSPRPTP